MSTKHASSTVADADAEPEIGQVQHDHSSTVEPKQSSPWDAFNHGISKNKPPGSGDLPTPATTPTKKSVPSEVTSADATLDSSQHVRLTPRRRVPATPSKVTPDQRSTPSPHDSWHEDDARAAKGPSPAVPVDQEAVRNAMKALRAAEQVELLDAMDSLRKENISTTLNVPQIVVCGDQSSGKSAVLEAISRLPFRSGSTTTTCFPTELVLRNGPITSLHVSIVPHKDRPESDAKRLLAFKQAAQSIDEFQSIHDAATEFLTRHSKSGSIMFDSLRIEVTGPDQPHLTLVDLPGLVHNIPKGMSLETPSKIKSLVSYYINQHRTIILAVVKAAYDPGVCAVLDMITEQTKPRTMGIITHPDAIDTTEATQQWLKILGKNETYPMGLGWHALCNLNHEAKDRTAEKRDQHEAAFFKADAWQSVDTQLCGIESLRLKLNKQLFTLIREEMPALLADIMQHIDARRQVLQQCGQERGDLIARKQYVIGLSATIHSCLRDAVEGNYISAEHADFFTQNPVCRLRDNVRVHLEQFAEEISNSNCCEVYSKPPAASATQPSTESSTLRSAPGKRDIESHAVLSATSPADDRQSGKQNADRVELVEFCEGLVPQIRTMRGRDLPGVVPKDIDRHIFRLMSTRWRDITEKYVLWCYQGVRNVLHTTIMTIAGQHTGELLWRTFGEQFCDSKRLEAGRKVEELLWPYVSSTPMVYRKNFAQQVDHENWTKKIRASTGDPEVIAVAKALDCADLYYNVALETLIENIAALAVERVLLAGLQDVIAPGVIACLPDEVLNSIGKESADCESQRALASKQLAILEEVADICHGRSAIIL